MTEHTHIERGALKIIELVGVSPKGFDDAVVQAVARASDSVRDITGVEVSKFSARVEGGKPVEFHAAVRVAFVVHSKSAA